MKIINEQKKNMIEACELVRKKLWRAVGLQSLVDFFFLIIIGIISSIGALNASPYLDKIYAIQQGPALGQLAADPSAFVSSSAEMSLYIAKLIEVFIVFLLVIVVAWSIFQGINWFLATKTVHTAHKKRFFINFSSLSLLWFVLALGLVILFFIRGVQTRSLAVGGPISPWILLPLGLLTYFLLIGYGLSSQYKFTTLFKKMFSVGVTEYKKLVPMFGLVVLFIVIADLIVKAIALTNMIPIGFFIFSSVVVLPLLAYTRVFVVKSVQKD